MLSLRLAVFSRVWLVSLSVALLALGCVPRKLPESSYTRGVVDLHCCDRLEAPVELTYLGVGGWLLRSSRGEILTAPFYSNPSLFEAGLAEIAVDADRIDANLPDVSGVRAILVGHGHYDHLMDVPWIVQNRAPDATVYANQTSAHQVAPLGFVARQPGDPRVAELDLVVVNDVAGSPRRVGAWLDVAPGVRIMPIVSDHAPHFAGHVLYSGIRTRDMPRPPRSANEWLEGETFAYLIDVLNADGSVGVRIYYQDAVAAAPFGFAPEVEDGVPIDVALIVPATYAEVMWHPEALLQNLSPGHVLLGHWENFFIAPSGKPEPVPFTLLPDFVNRLERALPEGVGYHLPFPGTRFLLQR